LYSAPFFDSEATQMVVKIEQIREDGLVLDEPIPAALVTSALEQEGRSTGFRTAGGFDLHAELHKVSGGVLLRAKFNAEVTAPCKRCLADVSVGLPVAFTLNLIPKSQLMNEAKTAAGEDDGQAEQTGSFDLKAADQEVFDGRTIDLDPILREQVLLALPMNVVCREDCKGLCPSCGKDLNEGPCPCEPRAVDPRLAALKGIKLN
ncbi:MAG TPA: DUF177 domain-containing protein, partial [Myxococcaceae bacterium]|nr:DUF177 domain-containing protein [Myxococcaceae bacterium]